MGTAASILDMAPSAWEWVGAKAVREKPGQPGQGFLSS